MVFFFYIGSAILDLLSFFYNHLIFIVLDLDYILNFENKTIKHVMGDA